MAFDDATAGDTVDGDNADASVTITVRFIYEDAVDSESNPTSFAPILERVLELKDTHTTPPQTAICEASSNNHDLNDETRNSDTLIMFLTDDCILLRPLIFILRHATFLLSMPDNNISLTIAYLTRLYPGIRYSQTQSRP